MVMTAGMVKVGKTGFGIIVAERLLRRTSNK